MPPTEPQEKTSACQGFESARRRWVAPLADSQRLPKAGAARVRSRFFWLSVKSQSQSLLLWSERVERRRWRSSSSLLRANVKLLLKSACSPHASPLHAFKSISRERRKNVENVTWFKHPEAFSHCTEHFHFNFPVTELPDQNGTRKNP